MYTYKEVTCIKDYPELYDESSMEYTYFYMTKRWYQDYVDETSDIVPDKENKKFILYLSETAYKQMKYNSHSFPSTYNGFSLEYKKKKRVN